MKVDMPLNKKLKLKQKCIYQRNFRVKKYGVNLGVTAMKGYIPQISKAGASSKDGLMSYPRCSWCIPIEWAEHTKRYPVKVFLAVTELMIVKTQNDFLIFCLISLFNGTPTFKDNLMPKLSLLKNSDDTI